MQSAEQKKNIAQLEEESREKIRPAGGGVVQCNSFCETR